ncbi:MAG: hypothetical protein AAFQ92_22625 [Bacteroidota bacterium]
MPLRSTYVILVAATSMAGLWLTVFIVVLEIPEIQWGIVPAAVIMGIGIYKASHNELKREKGGKHENP